MWVGWLGSHDLALPLVYTWCELESFATIHSSLIIQQEGVRKTWCSRSGRGEKAHISNAPVLGRGHTEVVRCLGYWVRARVGMHDGQPGEGVCAGVHDR